MVVQRLLEIIKPDNLYLGQKDYQQCMVITRLIQLMKQDDTIKVVICPTLREASGLALSSRNMRLKDDERKTAATIFRCLSMIKDNLKKGNLAVLKKKAVRMLEEAGFRVDYVEIADANKLSLLTDWDGEQKTVALVAAFMNKVRLIDNLLLN